MFVHEVLAGQSFHLMLIQNSLFWAVRVRTGDIIGSFHNFKRYVLVHTLKIYKRMEICLGIFVCP